MGISSSDQNRNRKIAAGGVMPCPIKTAITLAVAFTRFTKTADKKKGTDRFILLYLYIWLTGQKEDIHCAGDVPDIKRVSQAQDCAPHCFRIYKEKDDKTVEYAQKYSMKDGSAIYVWQPLPDAFQGLFLHAIANLSYDTPLLNKKAKKIFYLRLSKKWKTSRHLAPFPRVRKDKFSLYFIHCIQLDPELSTIAKMVMIGANRLQHKPALFYQTEEVDRLRKKILLAHNRYLTRVINAIKQLEDKAPKLEQNFSCYVNNLKKSLITPAERQANYLQRIDKITVFQLFHGNGTQTFKAIPSLIIGSKRGLPIDGVIRFFERINDEIAHYLAIDNMTKEQLREFYNLRTYEIAFQHLALTGARPTHNITFEKANYYPGSDVLIKDKGKERIIILSEYFHTYLTHYHALQKKMLTLFPSEQECKLMWYLLDNKGQQQPLTHKDLRIKLNELWKGTSPYQFRHFFAQSALKSTVPHHLSIQQIDRLMGHSNAGEHLGSDHQFPITRIPVENYLNSLPKQLNLKGVR